MSLNKMRSHTLRARITFLAGRSGSAWFLIAALLISAAAGLPSCSAPKLTQGEVPFVLSADGESREVEIPAGTTVQEALETFGVILNPLDRTEPPLFTVITSDLEVQVIRVEEEFTIEQVVIPFEEQVLRNESLPEGETRLIQPGVNGLQEITNRRVFENGEEISNSAVKVVVVEEAIPEVVMIGSQSPFASIPIPGRLAYLSAGNAWIMEGSTGVRRPIVTTGDLDGRVFRLSPDGDWLLFTRGSEEETVINSLWVAMLEGEESPELIDLEVENVIHFADFSPRTRQILAYSTVEPRSTAPGWQANNDLHLVTFNASGNISRQTQPVEANSGGIYGWWGTSYAWAPDGQSLAYARPDGIGMVDLREERITPLIDIIPLQTNSDWAWVPGLGWGPDGSVLYTVDHSPPQGVVTAEESPFFALKSFPMLGGPPLEMIPEVGMFAYPVASPFQEINADETGYRVAYLEAIFPSQSESSRYLLVVMDRDGSNRRELFPPPGAPGLDPQQVVWSPGPLPGGSVESGGGGLAIALLYQDNLWLIDPASGDSWQLTGDGLASRLDWK